VGTNPGNIAATKGQYPLTAERMPDQEYSFPDIQACFKELPPWVKPNT